MSELVLLHHNEPMTTSETLATGVELQHKNVLALIRKHLVDMLDWGEVAFQTRLNPQGSPTEFAYLNEGQSLFLLTLMKNSPIVVGFKKALVKAFLELRDLVAVPPAPTFTTRNLSHGADLAVAADRTFRGFLRSARAAGLKTPQALRVANAQTLSRTGMDMLAEIGIEASTSSSGASQIADDPLSEAIRVWLESAGPGPWKTGDVIVQALGIRPGQRRYNSVQCSIGDALRTNGLQRRRENKNGARIWIWERAA